MDSWQDAWNLLNEKLANECADDMITEQEMENILDRCQEMSVSELWSYYNAHYGQTVFDEIE